MSKVRRFCVGLGDQNSAAIGAGVVRDGMVSISLGTGGEAVAFLKEYSLNTRQKTCVCNHGIHGYWQVEGLQNGSAGVFRWFRDEIADLEKQQARDNHTDVYSVLTDMAGKISCGADGLLCIPHLATAACPRWNPKARGVLFGLTLAHTKAHLARSFMEGIILEQKDILSAFGEQGILLDRIRIIGGPTKSQLWNQIQADIYNTPTETLKVKDAAVLAAALSGAVGVGIYSNLENAINDLVKIDKCYEPITENVKAYEELYNIYNRTYEALNKEGLYNDITKMQ